MHDLANVENDSEKKYDVFYHLAWEGTSGEARDNYYLQNKNVQYALDAVGVAKRFGVKHCSLVNSGSSANLVAFFALTAQELGDKQIKRGDEVITVAAGFPTTVAPIVQYGAVPVFVDMNIPEYNIDVSKLEAAYSPKCKAVMIAHSLGNPYNLQNQEKNRFSFEHNAFRPYI